MKIKGITFIERGDEHFDVSKFSGFKGIYTKYQHIPMGDYWILSYCFDAYFSGNTMHFQKDVIIERFKKGKTKWFFNEKLFNSAYEFLENGCFDERYKKSSFYKDDDYELVNSFVKFVANGTNTKNELNEFTEDAEHFFKILQKLREKENE